MQFRKGDRIRHPKMEEWGVGEVLEDSRGDSVPVFFVGAGKKILMLEYVQPVRLEGAEADSAILDNLKIPNESTGIRYKSLPESIDGFLALFPEGFYGGDFRAHERDYKDKAHALALELLGETVFSDLLAREKFEEIATRVMRIVNATNLLFPNEKMALRDGLRDPEGQKRFGSALFDVLYGPGMLEGRFDEFSRVLTDLDAGKWTTASYFPFIFHHDKYMFVKPTVTQHAADVCAYNINYTPQLNWETYKSVLAFSNYLRDAIAELKPRDMIDVQSFMWCIDPKNYQGSD